MTPVGWFRAYLSNTFSMPPDGTSTIRLWPVSAMNRSPSESTATESGFFKPLATVVWVPSGSTSTTRLFRVSAMKTSPAESTATAEGMSSPVPTVVWGLPPGGTSTT